MPRKVLIALASLGLLLLLSARAQADPIIITGGDANTPTGLGNFQLNLTAPGFSFHSDDGGAPRSQLCGLCNAGDPFPTNIQVRVPSNLSINLFYNGVSYGQGNGTVGSLGFFITLPPFTIPTDYSPVTSPFSMSGTLLVSPPGGAAPFTVELFGSGTVTFTFRDMGRGSTLGEAVFTFAPAEPVPEPATLLLLGTGLAGVVAKVRRRKKGSGV